MAMLKFKFENGDVRTSHLIAGEEELDEGIDGGLDDSSDQDDFIANENTNHNGAGPKQYLEFEGGLITTPSIYSLWISLTAYVMADELGLPALKHLARNKVPTELQRNFPI